MPTPPNPASITKTVTVIVPTFNAADALVTTIESILTEGGPDIELIVIDGDSSDGTTAIIDRYAYQIDQWISEPDRGVYDAMNKGVALGHGRWFYFLGAGDRLLPGFRRMVAQLSDPATLYYGDVILPRRGFRYDGAFSPFKLAIRNICHQAIFYPRGVWDRHCYDLNYRVFADHVLNIRCYADPQVRFAYVPETVAVFEDSGGLSQSRPDTAFAMDRFTLIRQAFPWHTYILAATWLTGVELLKKAGFYAVALDFKNAITRSIRGDIRRSGGTRSG